MPTTKTAVLLMNLGSPKEPTVSSVREYLDEFLMDPYVIDLPYIQRWLLVKGIILNTRPKKTTAAYSKIWTNQGSPLVQITIESAKLLQQELDENKFGGKEFTVEWGMRYQDDHTQTVLKKWSSDPSIQRIIFIPMYPQYSLAATETALVYFNKLKEKYLPTVPVITIRDFYNDQNFIEAWASKLKPILDEKNPDILLLSYHGLPERQISKISSCTSACHFNDDCCLKIPTQPDCYRAQCFATSKLLCDSMKWPWEKTKITFQSRLGRTPWIKPYTDIEIPKYVQEGTKNIVCASPSFTVDCLETLEEIEIRTKNGFIELGGKSFTYVPCLNTDPQWIQGLGKMITSRLDGLLN